MNELKKLEHRLKSEAMHLKSEWERFSAEILFAKKLISLHPAQKNKWNNLLKHAVATLNTSEITNYESLKTIIRLAEEILKPIGEIAKKYTCHCVGHAHIDMNWTWSWQETVALSNDTFSTVLKLMRDFPEFNFSQSQASVYEIIEKYNPAMLEEIKERVKEGRWEVLASHWVEGDKNMAKGESLTRHLLYTRQYMKKLFALEPEDIQIDWEPDTFGHSLNVPTYLTEGGIKYYYLHRPGTIGAKRPPLFWWQSPNGSKVLVRNDMKHAYNGSISPAIASHLIDFSKETKAHDYMFVYGVGDHGGGPTRNDLQRVIEMSTWPIFPNLKFSSANNFFKKIEKEANSIPVLNCELNVEFTGCYTSQALIKKANRLSENRLIDAEFAATLGFFAENLEYPAEKLRQSWRNCLFNHFHDILPGSGIQDTVHYTMGLQQNIMANTSMIETLSYRKLASTINTLESQENNVSAINSPVPLANAFGAGAGIAANNGNLSTAEQSIGYGMRPFVIFNSTAQKRREIVEVRVWDNPPPAEEIALKDKHFSVKTFTGKLVPAQVIAKGDSWGHHFVKLAFPVEISGFGYAVYTIIETETASATSSLRPLQDKHHCGYSGFERAAAFGCENDFIRLEINPRNGCIKNLYDKKSEKFIISDNQSPIFEFALERHHGMSSWLTDYTNKYLEAEVKSIEYIKNGIYKIAIKVKLEISNSSFSVTYTVQENTPQININIAGTWLETGNEEKGCPTLRIPFHFNLEDIKAEYEIPFGAIERSCNQDEEVPALQWAKVTGKNNNCGCLVLNDCKNGYALQQNTLKVSLLRSSYVPDPTPDLGQHEINLALLPFSGEFSNTQAIIAGECFNRQLKVVGTALHKGILPKTGQFVTLSENNVIVSVVKKSESENGIVLRFYEVEGKDATFNLSIAKHLLATLNSAKLLDLQERPLENNANIQIDNSGLISLKIPAYSILSLLLT